MSKKVVLIMITTFLSYAWAAPGKLYGPETKLYTDFECLPPVSTHEFDLNLRGGRLRDSIPWSTLIGSQIDPSSRLMFEQRLGHEFMGGSFVAIQDDEVMEEREADALTGTPATMNLVNLAPLSAPHIVTPFISGLVALNADHHLYRVQLSYYRQVRSRMFSRLIQPGTLIFTHELGGLVLSPNRKLISICVKVDSYKDTTHRNDWLVVDPANFTSGSVSKIALHFAEDPKVSAILQCDELLTRP